MNNENGIRPTPPSPEQIAEAIRAEAIPPESCDAARGRVLASLEAERSRPAGEAPVPELLRSCADFQAALPSFVAGRLVAAKAMLVEDHTRSCVPCRKALVAVRAGKPIESAEVAPLRRISPLRPSAAIWALAATVALAVGLGVLGLSGWFDFAATGRVARVEAVDGLLFQVGDPAGRSLVAGASIDARELVRTGRAAHAVLRLEDGSLVEVRERSELSVSSRRGGTTIDLGRGSVLVQAAHQKEGKHLRVATSDCLVSVVGTVFSVNTGTKGSRVAVVEGEVRVDDGRGRVSIRPGQQHETNRALEPVSMAEEIGWSRDSAKWLEELEVAGLLGKEAARALATPERTSTALLDSAPAGTVFYVALPNLSANLANLWQRISELSAENPAIAAWWSSAFPDEASRAKVEEALERVRLFGGELGEEVLFTYIAGADLSHGGAPLVIAEARSESSLEGRIDEEIAKIGATAEGLHFVRVENPATATEDPTGRTLWLWVGSGHFAASPKLQTLSLAAAAVADPASNPFRSTPFHARLAEAYAGGVDWIAALDLERIVTHATGEMTASGNASGIELWRRLGVLDARMLLVQGRSDGERSFDQAELDFSAARHGMAAWLAEPAPMGSLEFVSPEASIAGAFVVKEPALLVDDLLGAFEAVGPGFREKLEQFRQESGLDLRADIAAPLGGELAFALDGPLLPEPAWKLVFEVYDPTRLELTIETAVRRLDEEMRKAGKTGVVVDRLEQDGRSWYSAGLVGGSRPINWVYVDSFVVFAPERALLQRAIDTRASGVTLPHAPVFTSLLPTDGRINFSAVAFQNVGGAVGSIASKIAAAAGSDATAGKKKSTATSSTTGSAGLAWAYGETDRITMAASGPGGVFGLDLPTILALLGRGPALVAPHDGHPRPGAPTEGKK